MRLLLMGYLLLLAFVSAAQTVKVDHVLESNSKYQWVLEKAEYSESERIGLLDRQGAEVDVSNYYNRNQVTHLAVEISTLEPKGEGLPFVSTIDSMYSSSEYQNTQVSDGYESAMPTDSILVMGHINSFHRVIIDSISGIDNADQRGAVFAQLDEVYRSMRWPKNAITMGEPQIISSQSEMLESQETYELVSVEDDIATIAYTQNRKARQDNTEITGTILYDTTLNIVVSHEYQKIYMTFTEYMNQNSEVMYTEETLRRTDYSWIFEKVEE